LYYFSLPQPIKKRNDFFRSPPHKVIPEARAMDEKRTDIPVVFVPSPTAARRKADLARELAINILREIYPEKIPREIIT
jgi:hypothetical protein